MNAQNFMRQYLKRNIMRLGLLVPVYLCLHCASDQSGQQGDPVEAGADGSNSAALNGNGSKKTNGESINNAVGGSKNNFSGANPASSNQPTNNAPINAAANPAANAALGASLNSATPPLNQSALTSNLPPANLLSNTSPPTNGLAGLDPKPLVNGADEDEGGDDSATAPAAAPAPDLAQQQRAARAAASPFTNPHMNWPGKGKVKYVTRQITKHSSPNGPIVGGYDQGEHPLVYQNGNWAELNDGSFVKGNGLTDRGVGYKKERKHWH